MVLFGKILLKSIVYRIILFRYLQHCLIDKELLSMRKFSIFHPPDENIELKEASTI